MKLTEMCWGIKLIVIREAVMGESDRERLDVQMKMVWQILDGHWTGGQLEGI